MKTEISVLLLHGQNDSLGALIMALENQALRVRWLRNCKDAGPLLQGANPPHLVFTATTLPDGTWEDVFNLTLKAAKAVNVIVTARVVDVRLYLDTIVRGAFDFIVPPLTGSELAHVVRCAAENVMSRREAQPSPA